MAKNPKNFSKDYMQKRNQLREDLKSEIKQQAEAVPEETVNVIENPPIDLKMPEAEAKSVSESTTGKSGWGEVLSSAIKSNPLYKLADMVGDAAGKISDSAKYQQSNNIQNTGTLSVAGPLSEKNVQTFGGLADQARRGNYKAAEEITKTVAPAAQEGKEDAQKSVESAIDFRNEQAIEDARAKTAVLDATKGVDDAIKRQAELGKLDPERYTKNLGVGQKTIAAIGMVLSGIGSGLTGQKNMALEVFQRNVDRDIEAQRDSFQRAMQEVAQRQGLLQTAKDRQVIATNAYLGANIAVLSGIKSALEAASLQANSDAAKSLADNLSFKVGTELGNAYDNHGTFMRTVMGSEDQRLYNLLGAVMTGAYDKLTGKNTGLSDVPLRERAAIGTPYTPVPRPAEEPKKQEPVVTQVKQVKEEPPKDGKKNFAEEFFKNYKAAKEAKK